MCRFTSCRPKNASRPSARKISESTKHSCGTVGIWPARSNMDGICSRARKREDARGKARKRTRQARGRVSSLLLLEAGRHRNRSSGVLRKCAFILAASLDRGAVRRTARSLHAGIDRGLKRRGF